MSNTEDRRWCIYMHRCRDNGKYYIGQTCKNPVELRWGKGGWRYLEKNKEGHYSYARFAPAIISHGWDNFDHLILFSDLTIDEANRIEEICIALFRSNDRRYGYNVMMGGKNSVMPEETKKKLSVAKKGKYTGEDNKMYGIPRPEEVNKKVSETWKAKYAAGYQNPHLGRHRSEEFKQKMREQRLGKYTGEDNVNSKPVVCLDLGLYFESSSLAEKYFGKDEFSSIAAVCREEKYKTHGHYFMYAEDFSIDKARERLMKKESAQTISVVCVESGEIFDSMADAGRSVNRTKDSIRFCVNGINKTSGGYHWRKATESEWLEHRSLWVDEIINNILSNKSLMEEIKRYKDIHNKDYNLCVI